MRITLLSCLALLTGCLGDKVEPDYIHHPKVKVQGNEICIFAPDIGAGFIYNVIKIQNNKMIKSSSFDIRHQKLDARKCIPQDILNFEPEESYSIQFSIEKIKNRESIIYTASIRTHANNGRDFFSGTSLLK